MSSEVQAVLFDKKKWSIRVAYTWVKTHLKTPKKLHVTKNKLRFRLKDPNKYSKLRIKKLPKGIELIIGFK